MKPDPAREIDATERARRRQHLSAFARTALWLYLIPAHVLSNTACWLENTAGNVSKFLYKLTDHESWIPAYRLWHWDFMSWDQPNAEFIATATRRAVRSVSATLAALLLVSAGIWAAPWAWQQAGQFAEYARAYLVQSLH